MNKQNFAALVRGLCIDLSGKPQIVVCDAEKGGAIHAGALCVEVASNESEESAALIMRKAYEAWKTSAAGTSDDDRSLLPSCVALCVNDKTEAMYWTGDDIDSAADRMLTKNASPRTGTAPHHEPLIKAEERANVVKNRIALVTGGAQGIGAEIVKNLAASGAIVFIADMNLKGAEELANEINTAEGRRAALPLQVNVCDEVSVVKMFDTVAKTTGGLDLCVSNAGVLKAGSVLEQELEDFKFVTDINYTGFFVISKHAGRLLRTQHRTAPSWKTDIVQINSKSGLEGSNKNGAYAGGKFGGIGLVTSFAKELVEYNIKVNALCPGNFLDGPLWSHPENGLFVQYLKAGKVPGAKTVADVRAFYEAMVPMKRGCTGKDLARALYYIVEQEYETGQAIPVTGSQVMLH